MFESLKKPHLSQDQTLMEAFYLTPEFRTVELLFSRNDIPVEKAEILQVLFDGDWKRISLFTEQQKMLNDLSAVRRQKFLMDYVHEKSRAAAQLIVKTDADFAAKKLEDRDVKAILELLNRKSPASEKFALDLLTSPRSSPIWHLAAVRLYEFANEQVPEPFDQAQAIARFSPQHAHRNGQLNLPATLEPRTQASPASIASIDADSSRRLNSPKTTSTPVKTVSIIGGQAAAAQTAASSVNKISPKTAPRTVAQNQVPQKPAGDSKKETAFSAEKSPGKSQKKPVYSSPKELLYVVKPGDSLEKIAKRFEVDAEILKYYNRLSSNEINPGSTLRIPVMKIAKKK
jgi:LysM repeat protein